MEEKVKHALFPPKAQELFSAIATFFSLALLGTQSIWHSGSGISKLIVGGIIPFLIVKQEETDSKAEAAPIECPSIDLIELVGISFPFMR